MRRVLAGTCLLLAVTLAPRAATADGGVAGDERNQALEELIAGLEEYAAWCNKAKLFAERDRGYGLVLRFDPEHEVARKTLGHKRDKAGGWIEPARQRPPRNHDEEALVEAPGRLRAAAAPFTERMLALLADRADTIPPQEREACLDEILLFDPANATVHERRGEVLLDGSWVLRETPVAKGRRAELKRLVGEGYLQAPEPARQEPNERERALGLGLTAAWVTPLVRVLGTGEPDEQVLTAKALHATHALFERVFGKRGVFDREFTVFLLADRSEQDTFLRNHPVIDQAYRDKLQALDGSGIQGSGDFAHWADDPRRRLDASVRFALGWLSESAFGFDWELGWVYEGFGLYLTRQLVGTRLNWFVQPSRYLGTDANGALRAKLHDPETNWIDEGYRVLRSDDRPSFASVFEKSVNELGPEDLLISYLLAAYLVEARPDELPEIMARMAQKTPTARALEEVLGLGQQDLELRVERWLSERR